MAFDPESGFDVDANGVGVLIDGERKSSFISGDGSPVGQQAPTGTIYLQTDTGRWWRKAGTDTGEVPTGWQKFLSGSEILDRVLMDQSAQVLADQNFNVLSGVI